MNERIRELRRVAEEFYIGFPDSIYNDKVNEKFAELLIMECATELRQAEKEMDRAYKVGEVKVRNVCNGYDFAEMLEERFGVE